ncbi:hypothetical protein [Tautonia plasticadhaerens]|uniref:DUF362 domain-containing protein n=1 Tax=Tautonia plasticadhaerens TaxID=2527974 RepID=A0A518HC88_9BACT|nr:hypothetical protein [Tautonia plasticadhaerens]QDV38460.1 hypothetical protein ElP_64150 [Tautonia plasticadhaerens]
MVPDRDAPLSAAPRVAPPEAPAATVAVVRSDNRRGAVAEALALLDAEVRPILAGPVAILTHLGPTGAGSTSPSALSSVLDVVLSADPGAVTIASGSRRARERFASRGFLDECWGRPVRFLDLARDEDGWEVVDRPSGGPLRLSGTIAEAGCRIALSPLSALRRGPACLLAVRQAIRPADLPGFDGEPIPRAWPDLSIIEGKLGWRGRSALAVAGLDPMAVDAVAAKLLGIDRRRAERLGAPGRIAVVGDAEGTARPIRAASTPGLRRDSGHPDRGGTS